MVFLLICIILLSLLFFIASKVENLIFNIIYFFTKSQSFSMTVLSVLIYPGVLIHELSHLIMAVILFVPVKHINLIPEKTETGIRSGSVTTADTDIVRKVLIGIAPLFTGIAALWAVTYFLLPPLTGICPDTVSLRASEESVAISNSSKIASVVSLLRNDVLCAEPILNTEYSIPNSILALYLLFSISATMYSSKKDLEALKWFIPMLFIIVSILYIVGFQGSWIVDTINKLDGALQTIMIILIIPLMIQVILFSVLKIFIRIFNTR